MNLAIIVSASENNVIGLKGKTPWHISKDMKRFKDITINHPVIMGRKTYESILETLGKPLPQRKNIVLSTTLNPGGEIHVARNIEEALKLLDNQDTYVIGGEKIYRLFLPLVNRIELTRIHQYFDGDAFFPETNWEEWSMILNQDDLSEEGIPYSFLTYLRKQ
jgi:dihydrofolate reductase